MAREKKPAGKPADEERVTEPVKLRATFKRRLQRVAEDADLDMGVLIEQHMSDFVNREFKRLLESDLKALKGE